MPPDFHRTVAPDIELRLLQPEDAGVAYAAADRNRERLRVWLPWVDYTHSPEDVKEFIVRATEQFRGNYGPHAGIWVAGEFAGAVGCHPIDWPNRKCSIGYWVDSAHEGKGLVTACVRSMLEYLFGEMALHRVEIRCGTGNFRSCAIPERLGFTREGVAREAEWAPNRWIDLAIWSMLEQEWRQREV